MKYTEEEIFNLLNLDNPDHLTAFWNTLNKYKGYSITIPLLTPYDSGFGSITVDRTKMIDYIINRVNLTELLLS